MAGTQGFASMEDSKHKDASSEGGKAQSSDSTSDNPSNFANDRKKASEAGKKGGESSTPTTT